jgi:Cu2+-exporting ATPase
LISALQLLRILDRARRRPASPDLRFSLPESVRFGLANTSLVLAIAGEMFAPALLPACTALLVGSNLDSFRTAGRQLLDGQLGLPVLYTSIVVATVATGQFVGAAGMNWMLRFWQSLSRDESKNTRRRLLGQISHQPCFVRLTTPGPDGADVDVLIDDLKPRDVILVRPGEQIPADGRILHGRGLVDERLVRGVDGFSRKQPDDTVLAGSTLQLGELRIEVQRHGVDTRVAALARAALAATSLPCGSQTPTLRGETLAERTVAPTMAVAGLGLLVGGASTALPILRLDYASGPGLAFPLETLQSVALCLHNGILIRDPQAIERLAMTDLLILENHAALNRTELEVETIEVFPGCGAEDLLCYATAAFHDLDDERAAALRSGCLDRGITPLGLEPIEFAADVTLLHGNDRIKVGDLGSRARGPSKPYGQGTPRQARSEPPSSLMIGINGRVAGLIHFRHSTRLEAVSALERLRSRRKLQVGIVSEQPPSTVSPLAVALGADFHIGGQSADDRIRFLQYSRQRGFKVAYVGDCRTDPRITAEAHVAISLVEDEPIENELDHDPAPIRLLQPRLTRLAELWDIAHTHQSHLKVAHGYALIPNLFCVAGALVWGFTSLASVVMTNLGTYSVYSRTAASVRGLECQISRSFDPQSVLARAKP